MDPRPHTAVLAQPAALVGADRTLALLVRSWAFANESLVGPGTSESEVVQLQHTPGRLMFVRPAPTGPDRDVV